MPLQTLDQAFRALSVNITDYALHNKLQVWQDLALSKE